MQLLRRQSLLAHIATRADDFREHVVRQLHALRAEPVLDAEQPPRDKDIDERARDSGKLKRSLQREIVAVAGFCEQVILDEGTHRLGEVGHAALVKSVRISRRLPDTCSAVICA